MEDIELAHHLLVEENLNLTIVKKGKVVFTSREGGLYSFLQAILSVGDGLQGAAVADKIVGSAIAMLCLYAQITSVYADIASQKALDLLKGQGINITSKNVVPYILNYDGSDLCPFEKLAQRVSDPSHLFSALKSLAPENNQ